jgi:hypothetical protein
VACSTVFANGQTGIRSHEKPQKEDERGGACPFAKAPEERMKKQFKKRGFGIEEFKDIYGAECSIQESSLATRSAIWLGCDEGQNHMCECCARMHVDKKLARYLVKKLTKFIRTGGI